MTKALHFTLGPVQGFIADARRTRDLWAGSFLLSWLSGQAMAALGEAGGKIIFPEIKGDDLFEAIKTHRSGQRPATSPYIGSLPNRFKADVTSVKGDPAQICTQAIKTAWDELEQAVWKQFVDVVAAKGDGTEDIWKRQIGAFWQMNWVVGEEPADRSDSQWLDERKNWRSEFSGEEEKGDLCILMGRYQEISGYSRLNSKDKQSEFYNVLREAKYNHPDGDRRLGELNIGKSERLCSIALIKRLFPLLDNVKDVIGWKPGGDKVNVVNWPSVSYVAAVPWLKMVADAGLTDKRKSYFDTVKRVLDDSYRGEIDTELFHLPNEGFFSLDGHLLHRDGIKTWDDEGFQNKAVSGKSELLKTYGSLTKALEDTLKLEGDEITPKAHPSEFYAILLMDGDRIGAMVSQYPETVKSGLATFTQSVKDYFDPEEDEKNPANGALIYAGGDDVLAVLPVDTAIEAARRMRNEYRLAFEKAVNAKKEAGARANVFTLSGAIIFAQYKIPLRAVLEKAHHYLDNVAKDQNGRDSLAITVIKPGGIAYDWVSCWHTGPIDALEQVALDRRDYSSSFFYNVQERYAPLFDTGDGERESDFPVEFAGGTFMKAILTAEYKRQPGKGKLTPDEIETGVRLVENIGKPLKHENGQVIPTQGYNFDGVLVARFMSEQGRWALAGRSGAEAKTDE